MEFYVIDIKNKKLHKKYCSYIGGEIKEIGEFEHSKEARKAIYGKNLTYCTNCCGNRASHYQEIPNAFKKFFTKKFKYSNSNLKELLENYINYNIKNKIKCLEVVCCRDLEKKLTEDEKKILLNLKKDLRNGTYKKYLSKKVDLPKFGDRLENTYGLMHLHFNDQLSSNINFVNRSEKLLLALEKNGKIYLIAIKDHFTGNDWILYSDCLKVLYNEFPILFENIIIKGKPDNVPINEDDKKKFWNLRVNFPLELDHDVWTYGFNWGASSHNMSLKICCDSGKMMNDFFNLEKELYEKGILNRITQLEFFEKKDVLYLKFEKISPFIYIDYENMNNRIYTYTNNGFEQN